MPTDEEEGYIIAIQQYLKGGEWTKVLRGFLDDNCRTFHEEEHGAGYHHEHWQVFRTFRQSAEDTLGEVLSEIGCSEDLFVSILDKYATTPPKGPSEAAVKEVYKTLLAYDDFTQFSELMASRAEELKQEEEYRKRRHSSGHGE